MKQWTTNNDNDSEKDLFRFSIYFLPVLMSFVCLFENRLVRKTGVEKRLIGRVFEKSKLSIFLVVRLGFSFLCNFDFYFRRYSKVLIITMKYKTKKMKQISIQPKQKGLVGETMNMSGKQSPLRLQPTDRLGSTLGSQQSSASSPNKLRSLVAQGLINEDSPVYASAMEKIYDASWKFDRGKDGDLLKTLDNRELTPEQFRQILRAGMNCRLSHDEFASIAPLLDNKGLVDGCEFILLFYRLRYEHRSRLLTDRVQADRKHRLLLKSVQEKQREDLENKRHLELVSDFTEDDLQSVLTKIVEAAVKYDRMMPGAVPLDAFDADYMTGGEFREQMKLVFHVHLSVKEVSAFINHFNKELDPGNKNLKCAAFLVSFFRMGFNEKTRRLKAFWAEKKRFEVEKKRKAVEDAKELASKNSLKVNFTFTPEDKERAVIKLRAAAKLYDKATPGAMSMKAFEVKEMPPHIFKEQLKRVFNLNVTPPEMGALMSVFDCNGDGVITCEEFTKVFINMGFEEREKELKLAKEKQKRYEQRQKELEERKRQELEAKNGLKVSYGYTEEEFNSAMHKLLEAAWRYDKNMPGAPCLDAFNSYDMEPHVLNEQLKKAFYMKLTPQELGAIMHYFDPEKTGKVHCETFLKRFFKLGFEERQARKRVWRELQKELIKQRLEEEERKLQALELKAASISAPSSQHSLGGGDSVVSSGKDFTEQDFQSAFSKLTQAAIKYDKSLPGAVGLNAFEVISMPPHVFREQLKLVFNVKISVQELWALLSVYDKDRKGEINCKNFINQFIRTGIDERHRIKTLWKVEEVQKQKELQQRELQKQQEKEQKAWEEVDFDFLEEDFETILHRFVRLCASVDRRQIGPAGFAAFQCESLNPAEFREMMKRTFNFKMSSRELGALVSFFDVQMKKAVHCTTFLNTFTQIKVTCEEFKGRSDEMAKSREYEMELKASYQARIARNPSVDARPWRQANALTSNNGKKLTVFKRKDVPRPQTAIEKYRLRLIVGRKTGRLDLACKNLWPTASQPSSSTDKSPEREKSNIPVEEEKDATEVESNYVTQDQEGDVEVDPSALEQIKSSDENKSSDEQLLFAEIIVNTGGDVDGAAVDSADVADPNSTEPKQVILPGQPQIEFRIQQIPADIFRLTG